MPAALASALDELRALPPLVTSWEILALKQQLADAQEGKRFLLQGGDCAETFDDCNVRGDLQPAQGAAADEPGAGARPAPAGGARRPLRRAVRQAAFGRHSRPSDGVTLPSYRGDIVNGPEFTAEARIPDPRRMIKAHARSAMTMNFVRALIDGGFADLHHPEYWDLGWVGHSPLADEYRRMVAGIGDAVRFMETLSRRAGAQPQPRRFLHLARSACCCRTRRRRRARCRASGAGSTSARISRGSACAPPQLDGAHVEYFRGIRNPIAVKVGPSVTPDQLLRLIDVLNPGQRAGPPDPDPSHGRGADRRASCRRCSTRCSATAAACCGCCDPMHGNTEAHRQRLQDAPLRATSAASSSRPSTCTPRPARAWAACTWS